MTDSTPPVAPFLEEEKYTDIDGWRAVAEFYGTLAPAEEPTDADEQALARGDSHIRYDYVPHIDPKYLEPMSEDLKAKLATVTGLAASHELEIPGTYNRTETTNSSQEAAVTGIGNISLSAPKRNSSTSTATGGRNLVVKNSLIDSILSPFLLREITNTDGTATEEGQGLGIFFGCE